MTYLESDAEKHALAALPLDSSFRKAPLERVVARLKTERGQSEAGLLAADDGKIELIIVLIAERAPDAALAQSIQSVALQSNPWVRCVITPGNSSVDFENLRDYANRVEPRPKSLEVWRNVDGEQRGALQKARFVTFLRHGDRLHPSAATWLAIERISGRNPDVACWGELQPDGQGGIAWAQRNPDLHLISLLHFPYLRNAFAVGARWAAAYPGDLVRETQHNHLHLFQIWLTRRANVRWAAHPEFFLIRADALAAQRPDGAARAAFAEYGDTYQQIFASLSGELRFTLAPHDHPVPYRLTPRPGPGTMSVVIPFRDKPDMTAAAVRSITAQHYPGYLEIILVNNQSSERARAALNAHLTKLPPGARIRIVDYDHPFNHSDQCNLGVRESLGEVVVFMNNDAELITPGALEELGAWASMAGIGTVGAAIVHPQSQKAAAGMEARLAPTPYFDSLVEERSEAAFTPFVREVFGNTFALAAVSRTTFDALGGLDPHRFPNGYNDIDFCCRARRAGLKHVALGHVRARHTPGQSRGRCDEAAQKTLIRVLYPEQTAACLTELQFDNVLGDMRLDKAPPKPKAPKAKPAPSTSIPLPKQELARPSLAKRVAARLADSPVAQRVLANPTAYRIIRRVYRIVVR